MRRKSSWIAIGFFSLVLAACAAVVGVSDSGDPGAAPLTDREAAPVKGALAPDFTLQTIAGKTVSLSDFRGKAVLVNFWATWCGPCRIEMPAIQDRFERYSPNLVVLAVDNNEPEAAVVEFFDELGLTFPGLLDPGAKVQELYQVRGYPSSYFVDQDGIIRVVHIGVMTEGQLDDYLSQVDIGG